MNRFPFGTTQGPVDSETEFPSEREDAAGPAVHPLRHLAFFDRVQPEFARSFSNDPSPWIRFGSHEESVAPQFAQNAAVDGLGKPHRGHAVVFAAGGTVTSGETGEGGVAGGGATEGGTAPGGGIG